MKTSIAHGEWLIGILGLMGAGAWAAHGTLLTVDLTLPSLCKWLGILLLAQSLARDGVLLMVKEMACECAVIIEPSLCLETVIGVLLLAQSALLWSLSVTLPISLPLHAVLVGASLWWLIGMALHDRVLILRRSTRQGDAPA
jgi:hypothetical protein